MWVKVKSDSCQQHLIIHGFVEVKLKTKIPWYSFFSNFCICFRKFFYLYTFSCTISKFFFLCLNLMFRCVEFCSSVSAQNLCFFFANKNWKLIELISFWVLLPGLSWTDATHLLIITHVHKLHDPLLYVRSASIPNVPLGSAEPGQELLSLGRTNGNRGLWGASVSSYHWMEEDWNIISQVDHMKQMKCPCASVTISFP